VAASQAGEARWNPAAQTAAAPNGCLAICLALDVHSHPIPNKRQLFP
jgi:hypothetical protein